MAARQFRTVFQDQGHTLALKNGTIRPKTFDFDIVEVTPIIQAFRRMLRGMEFDITEMAMTTYICARDHGKKFTALPIFLVRAFHHGAILVNTKSGIRSPKDLEGQRVGVDRGYTVTTGVWARGILQHEHGVNLDKITWVLSGDEHVAEYRAPANVVPMEAGKTLADMLLSGEIAATIGSDIKHPDVASLIPDPVAVGFEALRSRNYYPINHTFVVKDEVLDANPGLAVDLFETMAKAKQMFFDRVRAGPLENPIKNDAFYRRVYETTGRDPLPYGIEPNREMIATVMQYAREQGILRQTFDIESLFAKGTQKLVG